MRDQTATTRRAGLVAGAVIGLVALLTVMAPPSGAQDPGTLQLEQRLHNLRYWPGTVDGVFDGDTAQAVMAFQKLQGLTATGEPTPETVKSMASARVPSRLVAVTDPKRVEVSLARQVLMVYDNGVLAAVLNVSTGKGGTTRAGTFSVYREVGGWDDGPLGSLYNPLYFDGGIAIHGSKSVPAYPASHGCVRISVSAAEWMPQFAPVGTPVYVV